MGGAGNPAGANGTQRQDSSPTALAITPAGVLSFTSNSPDASGYEVLGTTGATGAGGAQTLAQTSTTSGIALTIPACQTYTITAVAVSASLGWTSDPSAPVTYARQPSSVQSCSDAPLLTMPSAIRQRSAALRRAHWQLRLPVRANGVGTVQATLERLSVFVTRRHRSRPSRSGPLATASASFPAPGTSAIALALPRAAREPGRYVVQLLSTSPDGKGHATASVGLEIT
jgi:hypothetical protein